MYSIEIYFLPIEQDEQVAKQMGEKQISKTKAKLNIIYMQTEQDRQTQWLNELGK